MENESILNSIKQALGVSPDDDGFDAEIIMHINSVFTVLYQLGVGPSDGFYITDNTKVWTEFIPDIKRIMLIKTYVYQKVRLIFDPPLNSTMLKALQDSINEFEYRAKESEDSKIFIEEDS